MSGEESGLHPAGSGRFPDRQTAFILEEAQTGRKCGDTGAEVRSNGVLIKGRKSEGRDQGGYRD